MNRKAYIILLLLVALVAIAHARYQQTTPPADGTTPANSSFALNAKACGDKISREVLTKSLELGTGFMLANQYPAGNFTYIYDWVEKRYIKGDNQVRQAGAAWGLALIHRHDPSPAVAAAVEKALAFFEQHSRLDDKGARYIVYPGTRGGRTGTVALVALAHIEYLRNPGEMTAPLAKKLSTQLDQYLNFLLAAQDDKGLWHSRYDIETGEPHGTSSPYFDGESLLALVRAARYLGKEELWKIILPAADAGYSHNVVAALKKHPDSNTTKGYYQWSSMAFFEIATSEQPDVETYGHYVVDLADWMIDVHRTLERTRNTGYAYEGIIHAYEWARRSGRVDKAEKFLCVIYQGLEKLTSWQVGSPIANDFISKHWAEAAPDKNALGGVQNHSLEAPLRIDVAQHQMHAVILALEYVFLE
jgi:UDP-N-acetylmuramoyl-tripeptide--D-alanyl-D-alanine ligase